MRLGGYWFQDEVGGWQWHYDSDFEIPTPMPTSAPGTDPFGPNIDGGVTVANILTPYVSPVYQPDPGGGHVPLLLHAPLAVDPENIVGTWDRAVAERPELGLLPWAMMIDKLIPYAPADVKQRAKTDAQFLAYTPIPRSWMPEEESDITQIMVALTLIAPAIIGVTGFGAGIFDAIAQQVGAGINAGAAGAELAWGTVAQSAPLTAAVSASAPALYSAEQIALLNQAGDAALWESLGTGWESAFAESALQNAAIAEVTGQVAPGTLASMVGENAASAALSTAQSLVNAGAIPSVPSTPAAPSAQTPPASSTSRLLQTAAPAVTAASRLFSGDAASMVGAGIVRDPTLAPGVSPYGMQPLAGAAWLLPVAGILLAAAVAARGGSKRTIRQRRRVRHGKRKGR